MDIQLCVEGDGDVDPAALSAAVAAAAQACPGARLARRGRRWVDCGQAPAVHVVEAEDFDRARLDSPLLRTRVTRKGRPSSEVLLVRGSPTTVIFRAEHTALDAAGVLLWQRQVFRALRGEAVEDATSRLNVAEVQQEITARLGVDPPSGMGPDMWARWTWPISAPTGSRRRRAMPWAQRCSPQRSTWWSAGGGRR
jgi:hypothetical protein